MLIRKAFPEDAQIIKNLVNEMYGIEYEKRKCDETVRISIKEIVRKIAYFSKM